MQLVAYGAQDIFLTGSPQITFFKVAYRRHTNFSLECIEHTITQTRLGSRGDVTILRNGDLVTKAYVRARMSSVDASKINGNDFDKENSKFAWVRKFGHALIKQVEIEIGGSRIDRQFGQWLDIWYELTHTEEQKHGYLKMIGDTEENTRFETVREDGRTFKEEFLVYVPLRFWWNRIIGLALPLIALQYHEVRLHIDFEEARKLYITNIPNFDTYNLVAIKDAVVLVDYVYLDVNERRRFAQVGHEYLIEQLQFTGAESITTSTNGNSTVTKTKLNFNHPCKELVWAIKGGNYTSGNKKFLVYTHEDNWANALDEAALRVFDSAVTLEQSIATNAISYAYKDITVDGQVNTNSHYSSGHKVMVYVLLVDGLTYNSGKITGLATGSIDPPDPKYLIMKQDVLIMRDSPYYSLLDKIDEVTIAVGLTTPTTPTSDSPSKNVIAVQNITVTRHSLTVRDISIPIANFLDNRISTGRIGDPMFDVTVNQPFNYGLLIDGSGNPVESAIIQLNGHDRFKEREGSYFNYVQPWQHHTHTPADGINIYSFGLNPEEHQPSGTANLSRIDNTQLNLRLADPTSIVGGKSDVVPSLNFFNSETQLYIYATNYNVLRILAGMGGLAYSS